MDDFRLVHERYKADTDRRHVPTTDARINRQCARSHLRLLLKGEVADALADQEEDLCEQQQERLRALREQWAIEDADRRYQRLAIEKAILKGAKCPR